MEKNNEHFFYVLECKDHSLYGGYTTDLEKRLKAHNSGKGAKYTRGRGPVRLIHSEKFDTVTEAMQAEYAFKQLTRKQKIHYLQREGCRYDQETKKFYP
ncbi:GIY-YIG nuclease family protein [Pseudobacillus wudalianchiensis]|uniref:Endonuclease n=1 Tax=Pseudobacillus wudalianchiensis TaxID=1743143 RepID=A0A1B9B6C6_9BACI|nr:GIY-YIG nuclease family protein [Bacillus wudalianchiensis]OCA91619.1 endonuclease [Bacillus wudalianchiensis]